MHWSIKTRNSQLIGFNHEQLLSNISKQSNQYKQMPNINKQQNKTTFSSLLHLIQNYNPISKYININQLKSSPYLQIKQYRQSIFYGHIIQNKKQLKGIMLYLNGRIYEGQWKDNFKEGKGYQKFNNGSVYYGAYIKGKPHGYGKYQWTNGQIYEGQWINGLKNGSGIWRGSKGDSYIGEWKDGKAHGYGVHTWINGNRYQGEFKQCLKHGQGIQKFNNGDHYKGSYQNGKPHGYGEYNWNDGSSYKGNFINGLRNGKGVWKKSIGESDIYEGEFVDEKKQGNGIFIWMNGSKYIGNFKNDKRQGYGQMYWTDGNVFKGQWYNGQQSSQNQYEHNPLQQQCNVTQQIVDKYNPQKYQDFDEPIHPQIVELKKYRARDMLKSRKAKNQIRNHNVVEDIQGGFLLSRNFITEAVKGKKSSSYFNNMNFNDINNINNMNNMNTNFNSHNNVNNSFNHNVTNCNKARQISKRPSRLSMKSDYCPYNNNLSNNIYQNQKPQRIKHCQSTSSSKNKISSASICNYLYVNKQCNSRQQIDLKQQIGQSRFQLCHNNIRSRNNFTPKQRMIKSSAGIRNVHKNINEYSRQDVCFNKTNVGNYEQDQNQMKYFSRSKNKSQIF